MLILIFTLGSFAVGILIWLIAYKRIWRRRTWYSPILILLNTAALPFYLITCTGLVAILHSGLTPILFHAAPRHPW